MDFLRINATRTAPSSYVAIAPHYKNTEARPPTLLLELLRA